MRRLPFSGFGLHSLRAQLMAWNILTLVVLLALLGFILQATIRAIMLSSIDRELSAHTRRPPGGGRSPGKAPFGGPPGGQSFPFPMPPSGEFRPPPMRPPNAGRSGVPEWEDGPRGPRPPNGSFPGERPPPEGRPFPFPMMPSGMENVLRPRVLDLQGRSLFPWTPSQPWDAPAFARAARGEEVFSTIQHEGEPVRVYSHPEPMRGPIRGVIQIPYPLTEVNRAVAGLNRALWVLFPLALVSAGVGGALLTRRALHPVLRITETAAGIGAQDLSRRLPVSGDDEFARLAATFNGMLHRLEASFRQQEGLVRQLERAVEQQKRFTADASHELRTPLTIIKANASLTLGGDSPVEEYRQTLQEIDGAADTMSRLVQDLLLLSRSDAGQLGRQQIVFLLREALERAIALSRRPGTAPIALQMPDAALRVRGNEDELTRLFTNLLENALRHTPPEGHITVTAAQEGESLRIAVADTGSGIAPEHLPHLGERFYRVDKARARPDGGTGLGLSICKSIVEAHGGTLAFESAVGAGTTVRITLPAATES